MTNTITENIYASIIHQVEKKENSGNEKTKAVLNQAVADLSKAASIVHQVHWYMRGSGFLYLHPKMDELMDALNGHLDEISERLITIGGAPFKTLKEFDENVLVFYFDIQFAEILKRHKTKEDEIINLILDKLMEK